MAFLLALFSALTLFLSFPTFDFDILAWIALVPLFLAIKDKGLKSAFSLSFLTGICFFMGVFYWINSVTGVTPLDFILLGIYLGFYFGLFGLLFNFILKKKMFPSVIIAPVLWVSMEYLRSHAGFLGLPWALLGHSQYLNLPVIQISSFTGVYGVSFLIVMVNAALSEAVSYFLPKKERSITSKNPKPLKPVIITLFLLGLSFVYGYTAILQKQGSEGITISVIQGNIPQDIKWNSAFRQLFLDKHVRLTKDASLNGHPSLIVWPETSVQGMLIQDLSLIQTLSNLARRTNAYLIIGSSQRPKFVSGEDRQQYFNSAFLISPDGKIRKQYKKIHLVPFAEYLPYRDSFPWPSRFISKAGHYLPGKEYTLFDINRAQCGVLICWENIFPDLFRNFVKGGAQFMVNITNEAWFGETAAPYQFVAMSVFRAVENRVAVIRSANTGISCFIDPNGKIIGTVKENNKDTFVEGHLTMMIPLSNRKTFYTLHGDVFAFINLFFALFMIALSFFKIRKG